MVKKNKYRKYPLQIFGLLTLFIFYLMSLKKNKNKNSINDFHRISHLKRDRNGEKLHDLHEKTMEKKIMFEKNNSKEFIIKPQPGDGDCLFHSLSFGLGNNSNAKSLRKEICNFIKKNPELQISDIPLKEWIKWDTGETVDKYATKMAVSGWGGAIEIAAFSKMKNVNVQIFEKYNKHYKLISEFKQPKALTTIRVLYRGGVHYDAIEE